MSSPLLPSRRAPAFLLSAACVLLAACVLAACVDLPQLPPAAPPTTSAAGDAADEHTLRFGGWNVRKLGFGAEKDLASIARIIEAHFDLIAIVELMWTEHGPQLPELLAQLGPEWSGHVTSSARPNPPSPHSEHYAVLYRPSLVAPCAELPALRFIEDEDGAADSGNQGLFLREPAFGCYRTKPALGGLDFLLAVYHARWGSGEPSEIAHEVQHIDAALERMAQQLPHERQLFVVGDFNLGSSELSPLTRALDRTRGSGSTLDAGGGISSRLYDHLLAFGSAANTALAGDAEVLDVRAEAHEPGRFRERVSDHLPLWAQLPAAPDDD